MRRKRSQAEFERLRDEVRQAVRERAQQPPAPTCFPTPIGLVTECCLRHIGSDERYCPRCGWEARVQSDDKLNETKDLPATADL